jgi:hypothetical protein
MIWSTRDALNEIFQLEIEKGFCPKSFEALYWLFHREIETKRGIRDENDAEESRPQHQG